MNRDLSSLINFATKKRKISTLRDPDFLKRLFIILCYNIVRTYEHVHFLSQCLRQIKIVLFFLLLSLCLQLLAIELLNLCNLTLDPRMRSGW